MKEKRSGCRPFRCRSNEGGGPSIFYSQSITLIMTSARVVTPAAGGRPAWAKNRIQPTVSAIFALHQASSFQASISAAAGDPGAYLNNNHDPWYRCTTYTRIQCVGIEHWCTLGAPMTDPPSLLRRHLDRVHHGELSAPGTLAGGAGAPQRDENKGYNRT